MFVCFCSENLTGQTALQQAVEQARHGHYQEARRAMAGVPVPESVPQQIAFHRLKAAIASGLKEPQAAAREMEMALSLDAANSTLLTATAVAELENGELNHALVHAEASADSAPKQALIGEILKRRGDWVGAARAYQAAIALAPGDERYHLALGLSLIRHGEAHAAVDALNASARALPHAVNVLTLLGVAQFADGYSDEAVLSLQKAINVDPRADSPYAALANIVLQSSAVPDQKTLDYLCGWNAVVCAALRLREAHASGDDELLRRSTMTLQSAKENDPIGKCELARAFEWQGNWHSARTALEACVRLNPTAQNHYRLSLLYRRLGFPALAAEEMARRQRLLKATPEQTALGLSALETTGITGR